MVWLGYLLTVLNYGCFCLSRFMKYKKHMLLLDLVAKIFTATGFFFLGSLSGSYTFIVVFFVLIVANIKERLSKRWLWAYLFFQSLYIFILIYTYEGVSSVLVFFTVSSALLCVWWLPPQLMRLVGLINSIVFLFYQISIKNWAGLLEIGVFFSNLASFIKYHEKTKKL